MKTLSKIYNGIIFTFLYAPIVVLIIYSFNEGKSRVRWEGFTFKWYAELFQNDLIIIEKNDRKSKSLFPIIAWI